MKTQVNQCGQGRSAYLLDGLLAGVVGSTALNAATYLDMAVRGRPASTTPQRSAGRIVDGFGVDLGAEPVADNRRTGIGSLLGYAVATTAAAAVTTALGARSLPVPVTTALLGGAAMLASAAPMTALGVTDPRHWSRTDWLSDIVPHLVFGAAAALTWRRLAPGPRAGQRR
ncbi:MAG TPA: hypothetical protein VGD43_01735 [Micromonospora sp.]